MSFDVKNLYHCIAATSFSLVTALEIAQDYDHFSEGKTQLFSFGLPKIRATASDETQNSLL